MKNAVSDGLPVAGKLAKINVDVEVEHEAQRKLHFVDVLHRYAGCTGKKRVAAVVVVNHFGRDYDPNKESRSREEIEGVGIGSQTM